MEQNCRLKESETVQQRSRPCPVRSLAACVVIVVVLPPALLCFARKELEGATKNGLFVAGETGVVGGPNYVAAEGIVKDAPKGAAMAAVEEKSGEVEGGTDCSPRREPAAAVRAGRVQTSQHLGEVVASKSNQTTADSTFRGIVDEQLPQQFYTPVPVGEGPTAVAASGAFTVSSKHKTAQNTRNDVGFNTTHLVDYLLSELPCKGQALLLAAALQNARADPPFAMDHLHGEESVLLQPVTMPPLSVHTGSPLGGSPLIDELEATLAPPRSPESATGGRTDGQSKPVGPAAPRSTAAQYYSASPVSSPLPLPGLPSPVPPQPLEASPPFVHSFRTQAPQILSSSLSASSERPMYHAPSALNIKKNPDPSLLPSSFGPPNFHVDSSPQASKIPELTAPLGHLTSNATPATDSFLATQQAFVPVGASTGTGPAGLRPDARMLDHSSLREAPFYVSSYVRRGASPAAHVPSATLASPLTPGPVSPTVVGARVSNVVGTAVGHTTQLVDDTLRSAILNVINPATYGATSLLHGIQALNQKLQTGSDRATKALLDFAAYRRNNPHHSLAEFINTLEEVTDTLNQAATTAPDPRLQSKRAPQADLLDHAHVAGGELLEGMEHNFNLTSPGTEGSSASSQEHLPSRRSSHQKKSSAAAEWERPQEMQEQSVSHDSSMNRHSMNPVKSSYSIPRSENATQTINLRDLLSAEQLQLMEVLTGVLNAGFEAALSFVKRQERGIVGLTQFPFFRPLQQRVIQAAYRASDRAAANRAALDSQFALGGESIRLGENLRKTAHTHVANRVLPDIPAQDISGAPLLTNQPGFFMAPTSTAVESSAQREAGPNVLQPTWTPSNAQSDPHWTLDSSKQIQLVGDPVRKRHQEGHTWLPNSLAAFASSIGQPGPMRQFTPVHNLETAMLYNTERLSTPRAASVARDLPARELQEIGIQRPKNAIHPVSPTRRESAILDEGAFQRHQQQQWRPLQQPHQRQLQKLESNNAAPSSFHSISSSMRRLHPKRQKIHLLQRHFTEPLPATTGLAPAALERASVDAHTHNPAAHEKLGMMYAGQIRNLGVVRRNYGHLGDVSFRKEQHREGETTRLGGVVYQVQSTTPRSLHQSSEQSISKSGERLSPRVVNGACELLHGKPNTSEAGGEDWDAAASKSNHEDGLKEGGVLCARPSPYQAVRKCVSENMVPLTQTNVSSEVHSHADVAKTQGPLVFLEANSEHTTAPVVSICHASTTSKGMSALGEQSITLVEKQVGSIRRLAQRDTLVPSHAASDVAGGAAAATLSAVASGVPVSAATVERATSHLGLHEKCVLPNVRYKGLASVVHRRSSLGSCQAACLADAAAAAVAARNQLGEPTASPGTRSHAVSCSFISYFTEVGLCYQYATVEGLIAAAGYTSAPTTCSIVETGGGAHAPAQQLSQVTASRSQSYASHTPVDVLDGSSPQVPPRSRGQQQDAARGGAPTGAAFHPASYDEGEPYLVTNESPDTHPVQSSYFTVSTPYNTVSSSAQSTTDLKAHPAFTSEPETTNTSSRVDESLEHQAEMQTVLLNLHNRRDSQMPQVEKLHFSIEHPVLQRGTKAEVSPNGWTGITQVQRLFPNSDLRGLELTGQQATFVPPSAIPPTSLALINEEFQAGMAGIASSPTVADVAEGVWLESLPTGAPNVAHTLPPVAVSSTALGTGAPVVPLPLSPLVVSPPPITALSALPPLPSITTPIAGTASSILQTAQGLMQTGNALMQAFPLQQLLDAGQQLYASGFFRNRGMKHLQLPILGQQKQELPPPPGMEKPTVTCATEGMTCCVPENAAEKWKERPPYLNNHEWDRKCRAHFVSMTNSLCVTTSYVLKGKGRHLRSSKLQATAEANRSPGSEDEADHCGLILTETKDFWVFRHTLVIPGRSMNNAICECKEPKNPNQEGLRQIEGFATWEFSLQAVHDMEAQVERGEKIAKGLGTALALTTVLGHQGEEALGHMLEVESVACKLYA